MRSATEWLPSRMSFESVQLVVGLWRLWTDLVEIVRDERLVEGPVSGDIGMVVAGALWLQRD